MSFLNILLSIPVTFYLSVALFFVSIVVQLKLGADRDSDSGADQTLDGAKMRDLLASLSLAGVIGFGLLIVYFSVAIIGDWRGSRGIFYPEDRISEDNLPVDMSKNLPPAPPAIKEEIKR
ncbi:MAG TPA: hypothetical protein P5080_00990 [Candidatus Paceibacterota bacterium]|nr:hypothetical protein [Candidatus Pacearchaeota archaeon]HRZ50548.1 hypothetical protein [Candidatus Paceibacterota bacterium]HSA36269.1 hypothetical protein [Candidatus Paceibacterota bacterium]